MFCFPRVEFVGWRVFFKNIKKLIGIKESDNSNESEIMFKHKNNSYDLETPLIDKLYNNYDSE